MVLTDRTRGILFLVAAALSWSLGGLLVKLIGIQDAVAIAGGRSFVAALLIWGFARKGWWRSISRELFLGALAYAGTVLFYVLATKTTTAAEAILLQYTAPVYVALLSPWLLREKIGKADWIAVVLVLAGMVLFFVERLEGTRLLGDIYGVISGVFFALCILTLRRGRDGSSLEMVLLGNLITAAIGLPFLAGAGPSVGDLGYMVLLGLVQLGAGYIFFVRGIRHVSAIEGALIPVIEPLLNPILVALVIGERPGIYPVLGGIVVVTTVTLHGIYVSSRARRAVTTPHPSEGESA